LVKDAGQRWSKRKWIELGPHQASDHRVSARFIRVHALRGGGVDDAKTPIPAPDISPWPASTGTRLGVAIRSAGKALNY
jgi:hypothetical protein